MEIDIEKTLERLRKFGVETKHLRSATPNEKLLFIERVIEKRSIIPIYLYHYSEGFSFQSTRQFNQIITTQDPLSRRVEREMSIEYLKSRYHFDFNRGMIFCQETRRRVDILHHFAQNSRRNTRYRQVSVSFQNTNCKLAAHRMIWAAHKGRWPLHGMVVDHIDRDTLDNRITNLREVTQTDNMRNAGKPLLKTDYNNAVDKDFKSGLRRLIIPSFRK